ncbi:hypothetical protein OC844_000887 [Tilletia horrida]|nr:hypothetical protein OC844_000887 [Tilletia horrida]
MTDNSAFPPLAPPSASFPGPSAGASSSSASSSSSSAAASPLQSPPRYLDDDDDDDDEDVSFRALQRSSAASLASISGASASSSSYTASSYDSEEEARLAQEEWDEGIAQLQLALQLVFLPYLGKYLGRRYAYTLWNRYLRLGPSWAFCGLGPATRERIWSRVNTIIPNWAVALVSTGADA